MAREHGRPTRKRAPKALEPLMELLARLETGIEDVVAVMAKWETVHGQVMEWADSLTSTSCGWSEYQLAQRILQLHRERERQALR